MSVTRLVRRALRARSPTLAPFATNVTDILEVGRVSPTISRVRQRGNQYASRNDVDDGWTIVTDARHECNKVFCANCKQNRDMGNLCYMKPLKDVLPDASDRVLYVFYDFETTQNI